MIELPSAPDQTDELFDHDDPARKVLEQTPEDRDLADRNYSRYHYVKNRGHEDYIDEANVFDKFYRGEQWTDADLAALEEAERPAMTVNMILAAINSVKGEYSNKRVDFKFKPKRDGATIDQAEILNKVAMHECDEDDYDSKEADMFMDGLITDRGYLDIRMCYEDNPGGEIKFTTRDPRSVIPDPDASDYDPTTWRDVITTEFMSLEEIAARFGDDKARLVKSCIGTFGRYDHDSVDMFEYQTFGDDLGTDSGVEDGTYYGTSDHIAERSKVKGVRVIDRQYYQVGKFKRFFNPVAGDSTPCPLTWTDEEIAAFASQFQLEVIVQHEKRIRWTVSADKALLHDDWSPYSTFTIIPFFPYFRRGHPVGMVRNLVSSQEILNKVTSQMLHIVNTTANSGWMFQSGSLVNMTADDLARTGSKTGTVIEVAPGATPPEKIKPNPVPTGVDGVGQRAMESIYEISGVNRAMLGNEKSMVSGIALENRQMRGLLQLQPVFDNLGRTRRMMGKKLLELIQQFYTDERTFMISDFKDPEAPMEEIAVNQVEYDEMGEPVGITYDLTLGKYGVHIGTMPARDVYNESQFAEALSLREAGIQIPDYRVIQFSNLDDKQEISEESKQMAGLAAPTEEELEMQQVAQEVQMQMVQIELEEKIANVEKTRAEARLAEANAMEAADKPSLEREKLELEATITAIEQATRERVTRMKELSTQLTTVQNNKAKAEMERNKLLASRAQQQTKPGEK